MSDFPARQRFSLPQFTPWGGANSPGVILGQGNSLGTAALGDTGRAYAYPFRVYKELTVQSISVLVVTPQTANIDVGVYDAEGIRKCSNGGTALTVSSNVLQTFAMTTPTTLLPGLYYAVFVGSYSGANPTFVSNGAANSIAILGMSGGAAVEANKYPLPATLTFAAFSGIQGIGIELIISSRSVV